MKESLKDKLEEINKLIFVGHHEKAYGKIEKVLANQLESLSQRQWLSRLKRDAYLKYYFKDEG